jgi:CRISPR-associated endonuclease/helicase Cas3
MSPQCAATSVRHAINATVEVMMAFEFSKTFTEITQALDASGRGYPPYQWQVDLYHEWRQNKFRPIAIPTGLGKTSVMLVWLLALASQAAEAPASIRLPRRFVYVVDRRTVVDQSTDVAEGLLLWLDANPKHPVTLALQSLSSDTHLHAWKPITISTLRGERADNGDWKRDPARPAIIIGTVYKIGSRLLFWGDGDGRTRRSMHAGLLGQDVLLVHDEAHLSPAFGQLIRQVRRIQQEHPQLKPFQCVELTATPSSEDVEALRLPEADRSNPVARQRLCADKSLNLRELDQDAKPADKRAVIVEQALSYADQCKTVIVYVTSPNDASSIARALQQSVKLCETRLLTGTLRGHERDALTQSRLFRKFLRKIPVDQTAYLISTSAGEVGVDMDADAAIFDLCRLDSFIQRAGRVNRSGGDERTATITLIYAASDFTKFKKGSPPEIDDPRRLKTLELLQKLPRKGDGFDVSPQALGRLIDHAEYRKASAPLPRMRPLESYLLDTWAITEPKPRVGPEVSPWLRGITNYDPPQTTLVWRNIPDFSGDNDNKASARWLSALPIRAAERATLRNDRAQKLLEVLGSRLDSTATAMPIAVITQRTGIVLLPLDKLPNNLAEATVILPICWGGLSPMGIPDASSRSPVADVADQPGVRERWALICTDTGWSATRGEQSVELRADSFDHAVKELEDNRDLRTVWMDLRRGDSSDSADISSAQLYLIKRRPALPSDGEAGAQAVKTQLLGIHLDLVAKSAHAIAQALGLDAALRDKLTAAGAAHDRGKARPWWQQAAGNFTDEVLAKCYGRHAQWRRLRGYRHEFGSLLDLLDEGLDDDLVLHLVASHHGRSRPGFDRRAFDNNHSLAVNEEASYQSQLRFDRLQRRYGWWGLAYLEALVKCADVMGSMEADA